MVHSTTPDDGGSGAQVKPKLQVAIPHGQGNEVSLSVGGVSIIEDQAIHGHWFQDDLYLCVGQGISL